MSQSEQPTNQQQADARLNKRLKDTPIAIVGMASLFANSRYLNKFWDLICDKIDAITQVPESRWNVDEYYDADKTKADKSYCKRGGFIPEVDFNPMEFGLPPNILELTDTAQLLSLIVAKEVLQDANLPADYDRDKIGITLGVGGGQKISQSLNARLQYPVLKKVFKSSGISDADSEMLIKKFQDQYIHWEENSFPGSLGNVIAGRIANRFDFGGINCVVDAACAGSLAAMRMAVSELVEGRSEMMITGGVCTDNSPYMYMSFSKTPAFTTNETIQPFDIDSKGMMIGEGIGMVALKRLEDAQRDGDRIYSVIKGVGASSDGKFKSIYAPRPEGQAKALKRAYDDAGFAPHTLGLIEAHGTGTAAGDVAEFNGLKSVFSEESEQRQHIALGSVKSQIGHTKSTAGTAGLIKAALALHHKVLPPTINVSQPNPKLDIENSPFYLNTQTRPWLPRPDGTPRRAGISSFGFGGTNFHFVLEEYSQEHQRDNGELTQYRQRQVAQNLLFSAANKTELIALLKQVIATQPQQSLTEIAKAYPLRTLEAQAPRLGLTVNNKDELLNQLEQALSRLENSQQNAHWSLPNGAHYRYSALTPDAKIAALFAGQGSQYLNMGAELACHFPEARQQWVLADKVFAANGKTPLSQIVYPIPVFNSQDKQAQDAQLTNTANAQTAIGALSMAQYQLFKAAGFNADMVAGHSFGELSALCAAGVIPLEDYYQLTFARGDAMAQKSIDSQGHAVDAGMMYAIITNQADDLTLLEKTLTQFEGVKVANYNSPTQLVIAGPTQSCSDAAKVLTEHGFKAINLPVSGAFHTPLVAHAQAPFAAAIDKVKFTQSQMPIYANATGNRYDNDTKTIKQAFKQHMLQSVQFSQQLATMYADGARIFVEFGPKNTLQKLLQQTLSDKLPELCCISLNPNPKGDSDLQLRQAAMQLAVAGVALENIDPYEAKTTLEAAPEATPSAMNIKLTATNHISAATQAKMEKSLNSGSISPQIQIQEKIVEVEKRVEIERPIAMEKVENTVKNNSNLSSNQTVNTVSNDALSQFFAAQQQTAELHQQFLTIPQQYGETFSTLMTAQAQMAAAGVAIPESLQRSMEQFHQHQAQTLASHNQFLELQAQSNANALNLLHGVVPESSTTQVQVAHKPIAPTQISQPQIAPQVIATATPMVNAPQPIIAESQPEPQTPQLSNEQVQQTMMAVVADKTGYPTEMLDLSMDMEADLGIDSIKRVEILGTVQDELPELPELSPEDLAECRTLGEIVAYMNSQLTPTSTPVSAPAAPVTSNLSTAQVQQTMMAVVADKTGYPTEMLDLSMDMEADLGIDSIKRVEILGTVQDELPELPELSPEDLAECRTLGEIVAYMNSQLTLTSTPVSAPAAPVTSNLSTAQVQQTMMTVVADKTGYPTEMLDLSMDMEADLGIDSIKRVEILGTVQDELPELPELSPEDLAECRTLGEIVAYMNSQLTPTSTPVSAITALVSSSLSTAQVQQTMMAVVADKTGYPTEMLDLSMDMEADLGIDSIKRVEILGTVQDELPALPELNPEDLAECRTLGEIISYMNGKLSDTSSPASQQTKAQPLSSEPLVELPPHSEVALKKLNAAKQVTDCFAADAVLVINDDGHNAGVLAEKLLSKQLKVVVVRQIKGTPQSPLNSDIASVQLQGNSEADIKAVIAQINAEHGQIHGFIHLQPLQTAKFANKVHLDDKAFEHVANTFLWAKLLQPTLCKTTDSRHSFITVSRMDGTFGYIDDSSELNQAALSGLTKTLSHEWPNVVCRALDIAPELSATQIAQVIVTELLAAANEPSEIGIKLSSSDTNQLERVALIAGDSAIKTTKSELFSSDKILVTGGAKGVTFECALALAKRCQSHFILAGRSKQLTADQYPSWAPKEWAKGKLPEQLKSAAISHMIATGEKPTPKQIDALVWPIQSSLEIDAAIQAFEQVGASAEYISMDVSNVDSVSSALSFIQQISPITGLIHGAGVLADKHIQDKTLAELNKVYGTKVTGLKALLNVIDVEKLKLVALFSSAAGFYGNSGQSDYAMSNEILNKAALQLAQTQSHTKVISFNWGPWDGGMVNPALKKMFTDRGVYVIPLQAGAELFANQLLNDTGVQLLIGSDMQGNSQSEAKSQKDEAQVKKSNADGKQDAARPQNATRLTQVVLARSITLESIPFVRDHCIGGDPVLPTVCAIQWMREAAYQQYGMRVDVQDYKLLKGIIFDNDTPQQLTLMLTPEYDNERLTGISAAINSEDKPQYRATLVKSQVEIQPEQANDKFDYKAFIDKTAITDKTTLYRDGTLFHGPSLQGLDKVLRFDEQGLVVSCSLPPLTSQDCGEFSPTLTFAGSQPFSEDLLLQAMLVWARMTYGAASLPSSMAEFVSYHPMQFGEQGFIELTVIRTNSHSLVADVALYHQDGTLSAIMRSAKVTISKKLNSAFVPTAIAATAVTDTASSQ